jgi:large subunit ribosomal protein L25
MSKVMLHAELRNIKDNLKLLRKQGQIPAVIYGKNMISKSIFINSKLLNSILKQNGDNVIIDLHLQKENIIVIIKSLQRDIITQKILHADFHVVSPEKLIEVLIPIHTEGVAVGVKHFGGILDFVLREVKVKTLPNDIPQKITINISNLQIGQRITIADLPYIKGLEYLDHVSKLVLHIINPSVVEDVTIQSESTNKEKVINEVKTN